MKTTKNEKTQRKNGGKTRRHRVCYNRQHLNRKFTPLYRSKLDKTNTIGFLEILCIEWCRFQGVNVTPPLPLGCRVPSWFLQSSETETC